LPAIRTYLKLGFEPWITDASHPECWKIVQEKLDGAVARLERPGPALHSGPARRPTGSA
jgi:hypothetical protein